MKTVHRVRRSLRLAGCAIGLMAVAAAGAVQNPVAEADKPGNVPAAPKSSKPDESQANRSSGIRLRRLESVTWNPVTQELTWVLSSGNLSSGGYSATGQESYVIRLDGATMTVEGEGRHFDTEEAEQVGKVMDLICRYALESTVWWEHGGGKSLDQTAPDPKTKPAPSTKDKDDKDKSRRIPPGMLRGAAPSPAAAPQPNAATVSARR